MKKIAASLALATLITGFSGVASASEDSGLYLAIQGGALSYPSTNLDNYYKYQAGSTTWVTTDQGIWTANVGKPVRGLVGIQFASNFAIEGTVIYFPKTTYTGCTTVYATDCVQVSSKAVASSATLVYIASGGQPGDYLSLLVKVGLGYLRATTGTAYGSGVFLSKPIGILSAFGDGTRISPTYGIALSSDMSDSFFLRFDWDSYSTPDSGAGRFNTYEFGIGYKF